jgi:hypothetical protein
MHRDLRDVGLENPGPVRCNPATWPCKLTVWNFDLKAVVQGEFKTPIKRRFAAKRQPRLNDEEILGFKAAVIAGTSAEYESLKDAEREAKEVVVCDAMILAIDIR